jgi:hypothetical protein
MPRLLRVLALALFAPAAIAAQQPPARPDSATMQQAYEARRAELVKDLQQAQDQLGDVRAQRVRVEARIDNVIAQTTEQRAQQLLMSGDLNALLQLDAVLAQAQENMTAQRDRMAALGDAVRKRSGAVIVVSFRADSTPLGSVAGLQLQIDNAPAATRTYSAVSQGALQKGAVDELYRAEVLPTVHTVQATVTLGGQPAMAALNVQSNANVVTYVQFSVRDGKVVQSSWTSQGTTP